tara:strand:+ start:9103 stop:9606 length:504 start_codon:yes stop_codon:yes gene_type:complete
MIRYLVLLAVLAFPAFLAVPVLQATGAAAQPAGSLVSFSKEPLAVESGGKIHKFSVELALNGRQQMQGLMFRRRMAPDAGMLFVYRRSEPTAMWMKNTFIPLDMLFIARNGVIHHIAERTVPMSEAVIASNGPVVAVLELNAGTVSRLGLKPGDRVISAALGTESEK